MDGDIDYSQYTLEELREAEATIHRTQYPKNFANLTAEIEARLPAKATAKIERDSQPAPGGLVTIPLPRHWVIPAKTVAALMGLYFLNIMVDDFSAGYFMKYGHEYTFQEHPLRFSTHILKWLSFIGAFFYLAIWGIRESH